MEEIQQVFEELSFPSASALKKALRNRGIQFNSNEVDALVKGEAVRQVQAPTYRFTGKIASSDLNARFFADLIDFSAAPSINTGKRVGLKPTDEGERYILVVQRVFDRMLWTEALTNKRPDTVAEAFKGILSQINGKVGSVTSDFGAEFGEPFRRLMEEEGISVQTKRKHDINAIATIDTAIGNLKRALARVSRKRRTGDWGSILAEVTRGQNAVPNQSYLEGTAPKDVEADDDFRSHLRRKNAGYSEHNQAESAKRAAALESAGKFRTMLATGGRFTRGFKPKWSEHVHNLGRTVGPFVYDEEGKEHLSKFTQPVSHEARDNQDMELPPRRIERGGSAQADARKRRVLTEIAGVVKNFVGMRTMSLSELGTFLSRRGGFQNLAREARLNMKAPVLNFLRAFPELFQITTGGDAQRYVKVKREQAFEGARRLRRMVR